MVGQVRAPNLLGAYTAGIQGAQNERLAEQQNMRQNALADLQREQLDWRREADERDFDFRVEGREFQRQQQEAAAARAARNAAAAERAGLQRAELERIGQVLEYARGLPEGERFGTLSRFIDPQELTPYLVGQEANPILSDRVIDEMMLGYGLAPPQAPEAGAEGPAAFQALALRAREAGLRSGTPEYRAFMENGGAARDPAAEQRIERLMGADPSLDRATAVAIVDGRLTTSRDPISGEVIVVDVATGEPVRRGPAAPVPDAGIPGDAAPAETVLPPGINFAGATGLEGAVSNIANIGAGLFNGTLAPQNEAAATALRNLQTRTALVLSADIAGRPSNLTREMVLDGYTVTPNAIFEGPFRAQETVGQTLREINRQVQTANRQLSNPRAYTPQQRAEIRRHLDNLEALQADYQALSQSFSIDDDAPPPVPPSGRLRYNPETGDFE